MSRLTKAELVNGFPVCYPKNNSGVGEIVMKNHPYREIVEKLKHYEDLEEKLISVYGECDGLLEQAVEKLTEYGQQQFGKSYRARLLTDEDADMWIRWKELKKQGRLKEFPCAIGDTVYAIEVDENNFEHFHCGMKISEFQFDYWMVPLFEKNIFLTREEAEAALKVLAD